MKLGFDRRPVERVGAGMGWAWNGLKFKWTNSRGGESWIEIGVEGGIVGGPDFEFLRQFVRHCCQRVGDLTIDQERKEKESVCNRLTCGALRLKGFALYIGANWIFEIIESCGQFSLERCGPMFFVCEKGCLSRVYSRAVKFYWKFIGTEFFFLGNRIAELFYCISRLTILNGDLQFFFLHFSFACATCIAMNERMPAVETRFIDGTRMQFEASLQRIRSRFDFSTSAPGIFSQSRRSDE